MTNSTTHERKSYIAELSKLVDAIETHKGAWIENAGGEETEPNVVQMPYVISDQLAMQAMKFLYDHELIVVFDWVKWEEGREFFKDNDPLKFSKLNKEWVLKLLTTIARNDRFSDGAWAQLFESGDAQKLYRRLLEIEESHQ